MSVINSDSVRAGASGVSAAYTIDNSCIFNSADSAYLHKTPGGAGNGQVFTISVWIKLGDLTQGGIIGTGNGAVDEDTIVYANITNTIRTLIDTGTSEGDHRTTALYRDPAAWYHFVFRFETTSAVAANRIRMYKNGDLQDMTIGTQISQNFTTAYNSTAIHAIGCRSPGGTPETFFDGYMADVIMIDGQSLAPTSFAETDDNGAYVPIDPSTLTFGTNGFHLDFANSSAIGNDVSGNDNDFTVVNLASTDITEDSPSDDADNTIGNKCTFNPLTPNAVSGSSYPSFTNGNTQLNTAGVTPANLPIVGTIGASSGKYYVRFKILGQEGGGYPMIGIHNEQVPGNNWLGYPDANAWSCLTEGDASTNGFTYHNGTKSGSAFVAVDFGVNDYCNIAIDIDAKKVWFGRNDTFGGDPAAGTGEAYSSMGGEFFFPAATASNAAQCEIDVLGGSPPSGFDKRFITYDFPAPATKDPSAHFAAVLYTGNGSARDITFGGNSTLTVDHIVIKNRDEDDEWKVLDRIRAATKEINWDDSNVESTDANGIDDLAVADGFGLGSGAGGYNDNTEKFVAYGWAAGGAPTATNSAGAGATLPPP